MSNPPSVERNGGRVRAGRYTHWGGVVIAGCCEEALFRVLSMVVVPQLNNAWEARGRPTPSRGGGGDGDGDRVGTNDRTAGPVGESGEREEIGYLLAKQRAEAGGTHEGTHRRRARSGREGPGHALPACLSAGVWPWPARRLRPNRIASHRIAVSSPVAAGCLSVVRGRNTWPWPAPIGYLSRRCCDPAGPAAGQGKAAIASPRCLLPSQFLSDQIIQTEQRRSLSTSQLPSSSKQPQLHRHGVTPGRRHVIFLDNGYKIRPLCTNAYTANYYTLSSEQRLNHKPKSQIHKEN
jgi:hypothetical protein